jgi:hypothetical protein
VHPTPSAALPDPAGAVFANCRVLVCTQADAPPCDFERVIEDAYAHKVIDRVQCVRSIDGTDCEERRAPGGADDQNSRVLKFRCTGDPVECRMTGGNATWETTLDPDQEGGRPLKYPCQRALPGPAPARHPVPGPNTVQENERRRYRDPRSFGA